MVDVSAKEPLLRTARATGRIRLRNTTLSLIADNGIKKGSVLTTAEIAGIQAAKQTALLIPLCHPLLLTSIKVQVSLEEQGARVNSEVSCLGSTGVEMEALTAVSVALLTIYDMCKAVDSTLLIEDIHLIEKTKEKIQPTGESRP